MFRKKSNINIIKKFTSILSDGGGSRILSQEELDSLKDGNLDNIAFSLTAGQNIVVDVDLNLPVDYEGLVLDKISATSYSNSISGNITFSASQDGILYTPLTTVENSYLKVSSLTASAGNLSNICHQDFNRISNRLCRIVNSDSVIKVYNPDTNIWSNFSLGFTPGFSLSLASSTITSNIYIVPGDNTQNFYKFDSSSIGPAILMAPIPVAVPTAGLGGSNLSYDPLRNRLYLRIYNQPQGRRFFIYDISTDVWYEPTSSTSSNWSFTQGNMVFVSSIDRLLVMPHSNTTMSPFLYNPFIDTFTSLPSELFPVALNFPLYRSYMVYNEYDGLVYKNISGIQLPGVIIPLVVLVYDPRLSNKVYSSSRLVTFDTSFGSSNMQTPMIAYNSINNSFYVSTSNNSSGNNVLVEFNSIEKNTYSSISIPNLPYKHVRFTQNSGGLNELSIIGSDTNISLNTEYVVGSGSVIGRPSLPTISTIINTNSGTASDCMVFIEPDGSSGSIYAQISSDSLSWVPHCVYNDLTNFKCLVDNDNYNTTDCGYKCTVTNGGSLATDGFVAADVSLGSVISSGTKNFYTRSFIPSGSVNIKKSANIGVELKFDI